MLTLKKLVMIDFGPVKGEREVVFPSVGTIGITGRNGIGKTHITAAVKLLLTGKTDKKLFTYINDLGRKDAKKAVIEGYFDYNGEDVVIKKTISLTEKNLTREEIDARLLTEETLKTKTSASVKIGDNKVVRAVSEVNTLVEEITGIGRVRLDSVFVDQNRAGAILHETPAELQRGLHTLSGAAVCQKAVDSAQVLLSQLAVTDRTEELRDKENRIELIEADIRDLEKRINSSNEAKAKLAPKQDTLDRLYAIKEAVKNSGAAEELRKEVEERKAAIARYTEEKEALEAKKSESVKKLEEGNWEQQFNEARDYMAALKANTELAKQKKNVENTIARLTQEYEETQQRHENFMKAHERTPKQDLEELLGNINNSEASRSTSAEFLQVFGDTGKCPTCGAEVESEDLLKHHTENVKKCDEYLSEARRLYTALEVENSNIDKREAEHKSWLSSFQSRVSDAENSLSSFEDVQEVNPEAAERYNQVISFYEGTLNVIQELDSSIEEVSRNLTVEESALNTANLRLSDIARSSSENLLGEKDNIPVLEEILSEHTKIEADIASQTGSLEAKTQELSRNKGEYDAIRAEQEIASRKLKCRELLEGVKTVLHRSAIPHDISSLYVIDVNRKLKDYCEHLKLPFVVFIHPDTLAFMAVIDGAAVPVSQLSGGQQTMAAWAWHLSLYEKHGKSFGMLIMDEPTSGVDEANMENIAETLQYMNSYCAGAGIQLIVITHENVLAPCFTHTVTLN